MRGMHRARLLFLQYAIFTTTSLTGLVIGASHGLSSAAWGLATGTFVGLVTMIALYEYAQRQLGSAPVEDLPQATAPPR
jgi:hypothetical protein